MNSTMPTAAPVAELPLNTCPKTDWLGKWIWPVADQGRRNDYAYFRRTFSASEGGTLSVAITADSFYWLYLDGELLARGPARAHLDAYSFDELTIDVPPGEHCLAIMGHHIGEVNATVMTGRAGVLADIVLHDAGGTRDLSTGMGWQSLLATAWRTDLPCTMSHFGFWEDCDLRRIPNGWNRIGFADSDWVSPVVVGTPPCDPWPCLCRRDIPLPRRTVLTPKAWTAAGAWQAGEEDEILSRTVANRHRQITAPSPSSALPWRIQAVAQDQGRFIVADFGRTVSGYLTLELADSTPGQMLELSYDDLLDENGVVNPERSYAHLSDRFVLPGGGCRIETAHPRGFRYVMIDVDCRGTAALTRVSAQEETYPFDLQPAFAAPDDQLDTFYRKAAETVRICTTDAFMDCSTRERVQWMQDSYLHARVAAYAFGDNRMLERTLFQAAQCALPDGRINGFFPSERTNCAFASSSLVWLHMLVDYWLFTGRDNIGGLLPTANRLLEFLDEQRGDDELISAWPAGQFWDWAPIEDQGCLLVTNAACIWALERLGRHELFRDALGKKLDRVVELRAAAHARFWDAERLLYRDAALSAEGLPPIYSQQANAMAVLAGVCPPDQRDALLRRIVDSALLGPMPKGEDSLGKGPRPAPDKLVPVGTLWFGHFLVQALFEQGLDRLALDQMRMLWGEQAGLPTFPETRIQADNTFLCHGWAAGPAFLLPAYVLGVQPLDKGWSKVAVKPHAADISEARGTLTTPRGPLRTSWRRSADEYETEVEAPDGIEVVSG